MVVPKVLQSACIDEGNAGITFRSGWSAPVLGSRPSASKLYGLNSRSRQLPLQCRQALLEKALTRALSSADNRFHISCCNTVSCNTSMPDPKEIPVVRGAQGIDFHSSCCNTVSCITSMPEPLGNSHYQGSTRQERTDLCSMSAVRLRATSLRLRAKLGPLASLKVVQFSTATNFLRFKAFSSASDRLCRAPCTCKRTICEICTRGPGQIGFRVRV